MKGKITDLKLYEVTEIDNQQNDKVTRYKLTCKSRRDKRLKAEKIVKVDEVIINYDELKEKLKNGKIENDLISHIINCLKA